MLVRTAMILGGVAIMASLSPAETLAASADCSGAKLTELRMTECLSPVTRGIRRTDPAANPATPATVTPGAASAAVSPATSPPEASLDLEIQFPFGSAELTADARALLQRLSHVLGSGALASRTIKVIGHTDAAGGEELNLTLSAERARAVSAFLAQQGVASGRLQASGVGKASLKNAKEPLASENRRVEIVPVS
jgi:outer membrane protein OmpA-like peptidoglycan-associated protein